jgi:hypothetical protein
MAGEWIKMRIDLASDPAVVRIRRATGLDADSVIYYDIAGATQERMQASIAAVGALVSTCLVAGVDVSEVLGTNK